MQSVTSRVSLAKWVDKGVKLDEVGVPKSGAEMSGHLDFENAKFEKFTRHS